MMLAKIVSAVAAVAWVTLGAAFAQTSGPAEMPPADYQGQSYVDSLGCIYLKAGYGGKSDWVPRVGQDRRAICGQTPTLAVSKIVTAAADDDMVPVRKARVKKRSVQVAVARAPVTIGCPASVPVARRYATTDGGSVVLCTAKNGSLTGAQSPAYPAGSGVGAALSAARPSGVVIGLAKTGRAQAPVASDFTPPKGYEVAWKDGRLNPLRGNGTAAGQAAQDRVWTRDVPAKAVAGTAGSKPGTRTSVSASNGGGGKIYVQVGAFGEPANVTGAVARLATLGLPATKSKAGGALQVVFAGPFATGEQAQAALRVARANGFVDAFVR